LFTIDYCSIINYEVLHLERVSMNKQNIRIAIGIIVGICLIVALYFVVSATNESIWPRTRIEADSGHRLIMGTFARIVAVAADSSTAKKCVEAAFAELESVDELMSDYKSDSEISRINSDAYESDVNVSEPTFQVLSKAVYFSRLSGGAFDITVGPLVDLWRSAAEVNSVPTEAELQRARSKVGCDKLVLDASRMSVRFTVDGMRLDLGGIAKGYAIDRAVEAMQKCGAIGGMVDVGGDIRCFGASPRGKNRWLIGLQDPGKPREWLATDKPLLVLKLTNVAVATSGGYQRFTLVDGKKYSHIINSKTGYGRGGPASVTVICKNATDADALATAVSVMGTEKGLALIERLAQTEAILIASQPQFKLAKTSGADRFINAK